MSKCSCVCVGDYDAPHWYNEKVVKAKKEHICNECSKIILPKEKYIKIIGKWEKEFCTYKRCSICQEIIDTFFCEGFFFGQVYEDFENHISEMQGHIDSSCLADLSLEARTEICKLIEKYWEEED